MVTISKTVLLYGTSACHLCEQAEALLLPLVARGHCEVELIDIAQSDELFARYGVRIPVVVRPGQSQELAWPFDERELLAYLA